MTPRKGRPALHAVTDGERPAKPARKAPRKRAPAKKAVPVSVAEAVRSGDRRQLLVALSSQVAKQLDDPATKGPAFAALIKQARELAEAIAALDKAAEPAPPPPPSVLAMTPNEPWDESYI